MHQPCIVHARCEFFCGTRWDVHLVWSRHFQHAWYSESSLLGLCTTEEFTQRICQLPHLLKDEELHNTWGAGSKKKRHVNGSRQEGDPMTSLFWWTKGSEYFLNIFWKTALQLLESRLGGFYHEFDPISRWLADILDRTLWTLTWLRLGRFEESTRLPPSQAVECGLGDDQPTQFWCQGKMSCILSRFGSYYPRYFELTFHCFDTARIRNSLEHDSWILANLQTPGLANAQSEKFGSMLWATQQMRS